MRSPNSSMRWPKSCMCLLKSSRSLSRCGQRRPVESPVKLDCVRGSPTRNDEVAAPVTFGCGVVLAPGVAPEAENGGGLGEGAADAPGETSIGGPGGAGGPGGTSIDGA